MNRQIPDDEREVLEWVAAQKATPPAPRSDKDEQPLYECMVTKARAILAECEPEKPRERYRYNHFEGVLDREDDDAVIEPVQRLNDQDVRIKELDKRVKELRAIQMERR